MRTILLLLLFYFKIHPEPLQLYNKSVNSSSSQLTIGISFPLSINTQDYRPTLLVGGHSPLFRLKRGANLICRGRVCEGRVEGLFEFEDGIKLGRVCVDPLGFGDVSDVVEEILSQID
jgi:hypothetical protein